MTRGGPLGAWCGEPGCDERLVFARRADGPKGGPRLPYEFADREAFSAAAVGCHVLVAGVAWVPRDLIEHFMTRFEISEDRARQLVEGYPFHRPHRHDPAVTTEEDPA